MSLTLGIYDVFTYAIPGSLYLSLTAYILARLDWIDLHAASGYSSTLLLIGFLVLSYLVGHLAYLPRKFIEDRLPWSIKGTYEEPKESFLAKAPTSQGRPFLDAHQSILLAALEIKDKEAAVEISRLRAAGLMSRNAAFALVLGGATALGELAIGPHKAFAACAFLAFVIASISAIRNGVKLTHWADMKTLELAFCVPEIDTLLR